MNTIVAMWALAGCAPGGSIHIGGEESDTAPAPAADSAEELPTPEPEPEEPPWTTPALTELSCPGPIPVETDIPCTVDFRMPDGSAVWSGDVDVHQRGRSSSGFPKPQYRLSLQEGGTDAEADLYGMGGEADWVLNGMWIDRALIRNKLAYDLFRAISEGPDWAPESAYVELTLDGAYAGVYLLTEVVDRDAARLQFAADDGSGDRFIVAADETGFASSVQYASWRIDSPAGAALTAAAERGVRAHIGAWEAALREGSGFEHMDLDSFVSFVLIEEFMKNNDAYFLSHRVWRGDDALLRMVPWDLDLTLGQPNYNENWRTDTWIAYRPELVSLPAEDEAFRTRLVERWTEARQGPLATDAVLARIAAQRSVLGDAVARNWERWDITTVDFGGELYAVTSPEEEYARVEAWIVARLLWMDEEIARY